MRAWKKSPPLERCNEAMQVEGLLEVEAYVAP
jgi:hypothetical protein